MIGFLNKRRHGRLRSLLSAYIDGQLSESETRDASRHLEECEECRLELDALRATVGLLRSLPEIEVRRSFAVSPVQVVSRFEGTPRLVWATRAATSVAAVLLVAVLLGDVAGFITGGQRLDERASFSEDSAAGGASAPAGRSTESAASGAAPPAAFSAPAPVGAPEAFEMDDSALGAADEDQPTTEPALAMAAPGDESQATPETAEGARSAPVEDATPAPTPAPLPQPTPDVAVIAEVESTDAAVPEESTVAQAASTPAPTSAPAITSRDQAGDGGASESREPEGAGLPLRQLEIGLGAALAALVLATVWVARRRRSYVR